MSDENCCELCEEPASFTCAGCKKAKYCGKKCQDSHWCLHIFNCNTDKPIKTFHHLARAIVKDLLPTDGRTLEEWGFRRAEACPEHLPAQNFLFGLYVGLVNYCNIEPKTLDQWRRKGILLQEIKKVYEAIPASNRGGYYPWLLRNEYVLDLSQPIPTDSFKAMAEEFVKQAWAYAKGNPRDLSMDAIVDIAKSWDSDKNQCFFLCGMLLSNARPGPNEAVWLDYGFCVGGQYEEMGMAEIYKSLLRVVSFEEFLDAFRNSRMTDLLKRKINWPRGLEQAHSQEFEDVMSGSGKGAYKSVWHLKTFVQQQVEMAKPDFQMIPSVRVDYGFSNCRSETERRTLLGLYRLYFDFGKPNPRPLDLHEACIKGKLFEHLSMFPRVKLKEEHRHLLKNYYPLPLPDV